MSGHTIGFGLIKMTNVFIRLTLYLLPWFRTPKNLPFKPKQTMAPDNYPGHKISGGDYAPSFSPKLLTMRNSPCKPIKSILSHSQ